MSRCPECKLEINTTKVICPHCSAKTSNITPNKFQYNTMRSYKKHMFHKFMNNFCKYLAIAGAATGIVSLFIVAAIDSNEIETQIAYCLMIGYCVPFISYIIYKIYIHTRRRIFQTARVKGKFVDIYEKEHHFRRHVAKRKLRPEYDIELRPIAEYYVNDQKYRVLSQTKLDHGEEDKIYGIGDAFDGETTICYDPQDPTDSRIKFTTKQVRAIIFNRFFKYLPTLVVIIMLILSILIVLNN